MTAYVSSRLTARTGAHRNRGGGQPWPIGLERSRGERFRVGALLWLRDEMLRLGADVSRPKALGGDLKAARTEEGSHAVFIIQVDARLGAHGAQTEQEGGSLIGLEHRVAHGGP